MNEAGLEDIKEYKHFNDFFTRSLKAGTRPISESKVVSPVDGVVSQCGNCLLYTSPSPRDATLSRMPSSA